MLYSRYRSIIYSFKERNHKCGNLSYMLDKENMEKMWEMRGFLYPWRTKSAGLNDENEVVAPLHAWWLLDSLCESNAPNVAKAGMKRILPQLFTFLRSWISSELSAMRVPNDYQLKLVPLKKLPWRYNLIQPKEIDCHVERYPKIMIWSHIPDAFSNKIGHGGLRFELDTRCNIKFRNLRWILQARSMNMLDHKAYDYAPCLDLWRPLFVIFWGAEERKLEELHHQIMHE